MIAVVSSRQRARISSAGWSARAATKARVMPRWSASSASSMSSGQRPSWSTEVLLDGDEVGDEPLDRPALDGRRVPLVRGQLAEQGIERLDGAPIRLRCGQVGDLVQDRADRPPVVRTRHRRLAKQGGRRLLRHRGQDAQRLSPLRQLGRITCFVQMGLEGLQLVGVEGVDREHGHVVGITRAHVHDVTPCALSTVDSLPRASRRRDLAVPSGRPRLAATSRNVSPPK